MLKHYCVGTHAAQRSLGRWPRAGMGVPVDGLDGGEFSVSQPSGDSGALLLRALALVQSVAATFVDASLRRYDNSKQARPSRHENRTLGGKRREQRRRTRKMDLAQGILADGVAEACNSRMLRA